MSETFHSETLESPDEWALNQAIVGLRATDWKDVERRLRSALRRDGRGAGGSADGFPSATLGGGGGGGELTSVESAANRNVYGRGVADPLHVHTTQALGLLLEASGVVAQLRGQLELIDRLTSDAPVTRDECELCQAKGELVWGTVGGVLAESHDLCKSRCYHFVRDNGGWPSDVQRAYFAARGKWRVRIAG